MYFNGVGTEQLCTKLDAEPSRRMSTDSSLCRWRRHERRYTPATNGGNDLGGSVVGRQSGILRRERARMENTSDSGACMRVKKQIKCGNKAKGAVALGRIFRSSEILP